MQRLTEQEFRDLLLFRTALRRFNRWSETQAAEVGLTHAQHQLLLAIRGHDDARGPTIGQAAEYLLLRHHSAVELVDRAEAAGLVQRVRDADDGRVVRLKLTATGEDRIEQLTELHLNELARLEPVLARLTGGLPEGGSGQPPSDS